MTLPPRMLPLEARTLEELVRVALRNAELFDAVAFAGWLRTRPELAGAARARPPDRLYRVISDDEREGRGRVVLVGIVVGYVPALKGAPAGCAVHVLGVLSGAGSLETPVVVPVDALEDVTAEARAGRLAFTDERRQR